MKRRKEWILTKLRPTEGDTEFCTRYRILRGGKKVVIHANILSHTFALPQFTAQHNCEDLKPTDTPSTVPTAFQASSNHTFNPNCAHNLMATQCNQSQYLTLMKQICAHNTPTSQASQINPLAFPYPPDPGEHVLKRSVTEVGEQDFSMNHQWTINLHDGYPTLHVLLPEEYIPPSLPTLCNLKSTMFHFGVDFLYSTTEPQHDLPSLASPKGEMACSFSWTSIFKSPTSSTLCFGDSRLAKLNQVKLLCETEFCITKSYFGWYIQPSKICCAVIDQCLWIRHTICTHLAQNMLSPYIHLVQVHKC